MPPRTRAPARRAARKPAMRRAKKMVTALHRRKAKKNMDTFFLKAKMTGAIIPAQGGTVSNYVWYSPVLLDSTNTWSVTQNAEFKLYASMYDKVRVNSIKLTYTPKANVFDAGAAQNDATYTLTGDGCIHTAIDRDGTIPANIPRVSRYPSYRKYSALKTFSRSYSVKYPTGVWLDCQNIFEDDTLLKRLGLTGSIGLYAENLVEDRLEVFNEPLANITLEYNCVFQGKTSGSLSIDDNGVISITPDPDVLVTPTSTFQLVQGGFVGKRYDASGSLVDVTDSSLP